MEDLSNIKDILQNFDSEEEVVAKLKEEVAKDMIAEEIQTLGITFEDLGLTLKDLDNPKYMHHTDENEKEEFAKKDVINLYRYVAHPSSGYGSTQVGKHTRGFCKKVTSRTNVALMRYQDILKLNGSNPGFGQGGSNLYSVFRFRGGVRCKHVWVKYKYDKVTKKLTEAPRSEQPKQIGAGNLPNA